jgi:hypothetical protein
MGVLTLTNASEYHSFVFVLIFGGVAQSSPLKQDIISKNKKVPKEDEI